MTKARVCKSTSKLPLSLIIQFIPVAAISRHVTHFLMNLFCTTNIHEFNKKYLFVTFANKYRNYNHTSLNYILPVLYFSFLQENSEQKTFIIELRAAEFVTEVVLKPQELSKQLELGRRKAIIYAS